MRKKKKIKILKNISIVVLIVGLMITRYWYVSSGNVKKLDGSIFTKSFQVVSQENGLIKKLNIKKNDRVRKGDLLLVLDTSLIDAKINKIDAEILYAKEESNLAKYYEERVLEVYINSKKELPLEGKNLNQNLIKLEEKQLISKISFAKLNMLKAELLCLKEQKSKAGIFSPADGTISAIKVFEGKRVDENEKLFNISQKDNRWVESKVSARQLSKIKKDKPFLIQISSYPTKKFQGKIFDITKQHGAKKAIVKLSIIQIKNAPDEEEVILSKGMRATLKYE